MADREKIIRYFRAGGDEELASRLLDLAENASKTGRYRISDFLDPHSANVAEIIAANLGTVHMETYGGFQPAERARVAFIDNNYQGKVDFNLACFLIQWDKRYYNLGHRDILGAFMGMGCKREILGDIVLVDDGAQFVCDKEFTNYVNSNLTQIGRAPVTLKVITPEELKVKEEKVKIIHATVAALRLDSVAAAGYGTSRSRMADEIKGKNVKVNWKDAKNAAQAINEGDVISFRGRGRVEVEEVRGVTKKGRLSIQLKRYI
jgi:RNA-binding protein YlmH